MRPLVIGAVLAVGAAGAVYVATGRTQSGWIVGPCATLEEYAAADARARGYPRAGVPATPAPARLRGLDRALSRAEHAGVLADVRAARAGTAGYGWTVAWSEVKHHPVDDRCAYPVGGSHVKLPEGMQNPAALSADWTPPRAEP